MQIRFALPEDARGIAKIHVDTWRAAYAGIVPAEFLASLEVEKREAMWLANIVQGSPWILVAFEAGELLGWIAYGACRDHGATPDSAEVWAIYVAVAQWRRGVGRQLWARAHAELRGQAFTSVALWALSQNSRAGDFYRALGFALQPDSAKQFTLGGATLDEVRYVRPVDA